MDETPEVVAWAWVWAWFVDRRHVSDSEEEAEEEEDESLSGCGVTNWSSNRLPLDLVGRKEGGRGKQ